MQLFFFHLSILVVKVIIVTYLETIISNKVQKRIISKGKTEFRDKDVAIFYAVFALSIFTVVNPPLSLVAGNEVGTLNLSFRLFSK